MREYFEEQIKNRKSITEERLKELKGKSLYSNYQVGDRILVFLYKKLKSIEPHPKVTLSVNMVAERELDLMEDEYQFVRMADDELPVFAKKGEFKWL